MLTLGIDVGSAAVKVAMMRHTAAESSLLACEVERYRRRNPKAVIAHAVETVKKRAALETTALGYIATTGEGELAPARDGHFYGMTSHARGALFLDGRARSVMDLGALHARAIRIDERGRVLGYRMTSQCASGSGQFIENIARYLGVALSDVGRVSREAQAEEPVSGICAVLAETDVINMVARGIPAPTILRGIHRAVASRLAKLLRLSGGASPVLLTGGLAADEGLLEALRRQLVEDRLELEVLTHPQAVYAGAIGAALWGAFRAQRQQSEPTPLSQEETFHAAKQA